jgi:hypothetical protein
MADLTNLCDKDCVEYTNNNDLPILGATGHTNVDTCRFPQRDHVDGVSSDCLQSQQDDIDSANQVLLNDTTFSAPFRQNEPTEVETAKKDLQERLEVVLQKLSNEHKMLEREDSDGNEEQTHADSHCGGNVSETHCSVICEDSYDDQKSVIDELTADYVKLRENVGEANGSDCNTLQFPKDMEEVGRYAYITLVAHSLFMLFDYSEWHR